MKFKSVFLLQLLCVFALSVQAQQKHEQTRVIVADYMQERGKLCKVFKECIGAGRANEGLRADWQEQLTLVQKEIGFKYIRMHGLLCDDMGVYKEDKNGNPVYNWQYIDKLYDFLLRVGMKPFVELAFMPSDLASEPTTVFWWKGNVSPPKSYDRWADLIRHLTMHLVERYGMEEVKTWYFEVWNEPDISAFYKKPIEEYWKLYQYSVKAIKSVSRDFKVGGPASAMPYAYEEKFLDYCIRNNVPVDFVATHAYGVKSGYFDESGQQGTVLDPNPEAVRSRMIHSREIIRQSALPNLELHFTEWSSAYTPTDYIHDTYIQAPFILDKIKGAQESVNSMSYWVFTDIFEENGPRMTPFHGGFGMLNYQGIEKPAYYAYQYLNQLGNVELKVNDASSWICKDATGNVQALFWDFYPIEPPDSLNDQVFYKRDFPAMNKGKVRVEIANVPSGRYQLKLFQTGYRVNDAYTSYLDLGAPSQLTRSQEQTIKDLNPGLPVKQEIITIADARFVIELPLRDNDVFLLMLQKL